MKTQDQQIAHAHSKLVRLYTARNALQRKLNQIDIDIRATTQTSNNLNQANTADKT